MVRKTYECVCVALILNRISSKLFTHTPSRNKSFASAVISAVPFWGRSTKTNFCRPYLNELGGEPKLQFQWSLGHNN